MNDTRQKDKDQPVDFIRSGRDFLSKHGNDQSISWTVTVDKHGYMRHTLNIRITNPLMSPGTEACCEGMAPSYPDPAKKRYAEEAVFMADTIARHMKLYRAAVYEAQEAVEIAFARRYKDNPNY